MSKTSKGSVYQQITDNIVKSIEDGVVPWKKEWKAGTNVMPMSHTTERCYTGGTNILQLWVTQALNDYQHNRWLTYKAAKDLGFCVGKGEKATLVTYVGTGGQKDEEGDRTYRYHKPYWVFNVEQVPGLVETIPVPETNDHNPADVEMATIIPDALGVTVQDGQPCYVPSTDMIRMPDLGLFTTPEAYMSTLAHECVHATGAKTRCDRQLTGRFGDEAYAMEELIAELGAAFISGQWGMSYQLEQHASYLASWLKVFKSDPKALFAASTKATQAVTYIENSLRTHRCERSSLDTLIQAA